MTIHPSWSMSRKRSFIMFWNVAGALHRPKNMTVGSNNPLGVINAAFHSSPSLMRTLLYPARTSSLVNIVAPYSRSMMSLMSGK